MATEVADETHHGFALDPTPLSEEGRDTLFTGARTVNAFAQDPVTDEQLREIYELAKFPPTSVNCNPLRYLILRSREAKNRLLPHLFDTNRVKMASAPAVAVLAVDTEFHEQIPRLLPFKPEYREVLAADAALRDATGRFNAALQAAYFIMAIRAVGLAAGPMIGFYRDGVDGEFFAESSWRSILLVNIGKPARTEPWFERLPRLDYDAAVRHA